jgi:hypothetical protein
MHTQVCVEVHMHNVIHITVIHIIQDSTPRHLGGRENRSHHSHQRPKEGRQGHHRHWSPKQGRKGREEEQAGGTPAEPP